MECPSVLITTPSMLFIFEGSSFIVAAISGNSSHPEEAINIFVFLLSKMQKKTQNAIEKSGRELG